MDRHPLLRPFAAGLIALAVLWPSAAHAQRHAARHARAGSVVFIGGYFYDPVFGPYPWWSPAAYPYGYYPAYYDDRAEVRVLVQPEDASVYVDGYYAGIVDDFNGFFHRLPLSPGGHEFVLYRDGYRTVHQKLYLSPNSTVKLRYTMEKLGPGEASEPPPEAPPVPPPPPGSAMPPRTPRHMPPGAPPMPPPGMPPPGPETPPMPPVRGQVEAGEFGTLAIRVQPADAEITIDGERWQTSGEGAPLTVHVAAGSHRVEIEKSGYRRFSADVQVRPGETMPLNVSLSPE